MNVFYLDKDPQRCAQAYYDRHVVKMILETAQMLSTAHRVVDKDVLSNEYNLVLYKKTHENHPSSRWVRESFENYVWAYRLLSFLCQEYTYRYGKKHATERLLPILCYAPEELESSKFTAPPSVMPVEYQISDSSLVNYRNYYINGKYALQKYTRRESPNWLLTK